MKTLFTVDKNEKKLFQIDNPNTGRRAKINRIARLIYAHQGYQVPEGYRFDTAHHPQETSAWKCAEEITKLK